LKQRTLIFSQKSRQENHSTIEKLP